MRAGPLVVSVGSLTRHWEPGPGKGRDGTSMVTGMPSRKLLERAARGLVAAGLLVAEPETCALPDVVRALIFTVSPSQPEALQEAQIRAWASAVGDLASDRTLAVESLQLGILPALPNFLHLYKSTATQADISWSDALVALHNFALCEDQGFPEALGKLQQPELVAIAVNLTRALKQGLHPSEARDASARLANYDSMINPLIDAGVLEALTQYMPTVKPLTKQQQWGADALREINNSLSAMDILLYMYTKVDREQDLPTNSLATSSLTGWVCDVLQGTPSNDHKYKEEVEVSRISALECLTSLLINATVCRLAVPNNRSMLFRVASAITSTSSTALLSAAAQVLAQALSEEDLVQPNELASLHTYDLVRHLSQVLDESRDFKDLLNVLAALQNILDPAHFKNSTVAMRKVAERLVACSFEPQLAEFVQNQQKHFDIQTQPDGTAYPSQEDIESLDETSKGALENARTLLQAVGPLTSVQVVPRVPRTKDSGNKDKDGKRSGATSGPGGRKGAQNVPADVLASVSGSGAKEGKPKRKLGDGPSEASKRRRSETALPLAERVLLEKELRRAAAVAAPLLAGPPMRAVLDWFNEWGWCRKRLEEELGTDVHLEGGGHYQLLQDAIEHADPWACLDLLRDILQIKLPPVAEGKVAPVVKRTPKAAVLAAAVKCEGAPAPGASLPSQHAPAVMASAPEPTVVPAVGLQPSFHQGPAQPGIAADAQAADAAAAAQAALAAMTQQESLLVPQEYLAAALGAASGGAVPMQQ